MTETTIPTAELARLRGIEAETRRFAAAWNGDVGQLVEAGEDFVEALDVLQFGKGAVPEWWQCDYPRS